MLLLGGVAVLVTFFVAVRLLLWEPHLSNYDMIEAPSITATVGTSAKSTQSLLRDVTKKTGAPWPETCVPRKPANQLCLLILRAPRTNVERKFLLIFMAQRAAAVLGS